MGDECECRENPNFKFKLPDTLCLARVFCHARNERDDCLIEMANVTEDFLLDPLRDEARRGIALFLLDRGVVPGDPTPPTLTQYSSTAATLLHQSRVYASRNDWRSAMVSLYKVVYMKSSIRFHPDYNSPSEIANVANLASRGSEALSDSSTVRPRALLYLREEYRSSALESEYDIKPSLHRHPAPGSDSASLPITSSELRGSRASPPAELPRVVKGSNLPLPSHASSTLRQLPLPQRTSSSPIVSVTADAASRYESLRSSLNAASHSERPGLRRIILPSALVNIFSSAAAANTNIAPRGIETCGLLLGREETPSRNLLVSHIFLPTQKGGENDCELLPSGEDALLRYCLENGLMTLGWIHTHPSQGCFMSAVDVHTHSSYQASLPEAIAIVVAPNDPHSPPGGRFAIFRLTDETTPASVLLRPQTRDDATVDANAAAPRSLITSGMYRTGLSIILSCKQRGFHPHDETSEMTIYEESKHIAIESGRGIEFVDQRVGQLESLYVPPERATAASISVPSRATAEFPHSPLAPMNLYPQINKAAAQSAPKQRLTIDPTVAPTQAGTEVPRAVAMYPKVVPLGGAGRGSAFYESAEASSGPKSPFYESALLEATRTTAASKFYESALLNAEIEGSEVAPRR